MFFISKKTKQLLQNYMFNILSIDRLHLYKFNMQKMMYRI